MENFDRIYYIDDTTGELRSSKLFARVVEVNGKKVTQLFVDIVVE